jgi:hypothetical protein
MACFSSVLGLALLLVLAAFCGFGFLAAHEGLDFQEMCAAQLVYGVVGLASLGGAAWLANSAGQMRQREHWLNGVKHFIRYSWRMAPIKTEREVDSH